MRHMLGGGHGKKRSIWQPDGMRTVADTIHDFLDIFSISSRHHLITLEELLTSIIHFITTHL
jgi:hypothetical protein